MAAAFGAWLLSGVIRKKLGFNLISEKTDGGREAGAVVGDDDCDVSLRRTLKLEIARLRGLELPELRVIWENYYGTVAPQDPPSREMLIRSVLWQMQAKVLVV
jgi:hypothetical protein